MSQHTKVIETVIKNMLRMKQGIQAGGVLLTGDPGIGKTTVIEMMSYLLGIKSIIIEVPHITEEHLINIPFLVYNPATNQGQMMKSQESDGEYKMVLAQSNLYTQITQAKAMPDAEYLEHIKNAPAHIQAAFKYFGGNETTIPPLFRSVRAKFDCILFLDEFYRQTSMRIRNILRGILNKRIGMHQLPSNTYVVYASNMKDAGLDEIPSNHQFQSVSFRAASKEDWFAWLIGKYQNDPDVQLNPTIVKKFAELLTDDDISYTDVNHEVRTSPRRWEQLMLYINGALPVENVQDAKSLLTNVKNSFINYLTKQHSELADKVLPAVRELIKETSNMEAEATNEEHEWRETLDHQIKMQMKLGGHKRYIPVISGDPGIGKTTAAWQVAKKYDLRLIDIDVSEIYADDASGLPVPGGSAEDRATGKMSIRFSAPKLYQQIMKQIEEADANHIQNLREKFGDQAEEKIKEYQNRKYKYLILFDEINRVDEKTFNALRKVILEKNFGPAGDNSGKNLTLPKEAITMAAMNPEGVGVSELTSHFRDVIDVIPAKATWSKAKAFLESRSILSVDDTEIAQPFKEAALQLLDLFVNKFKVKSSSVPLEQQPFILDLGAHVYVSPREYNDMYVQMVQDLDYEFSKLDEGASIVEIKEAMDGPIADAFEQGLNHPLVKAGVDGDEFIHTMKEWLRGLPPKQYGSLLTRMANTAGGVSTSMSSWLDKQDMSSMPEDLDLVNAHSGINNAQVVDQIREAIRSKIVDGQTLQKYVTGPTHKKVEFNGDDIVHTGEQVPQLTNFVLAMLYTLRVHSFSNDRIGVIGKAVTTGIREALTSLVRTNKISVQQATDAMVEVANLRGDIVEFVESLETEYK